MSFPFPLPPLEMWGGLECTINRVGETYFDQLERNGHVNRLDDLYRFAELGIRTIRYPIQWERISPDGISQANWSWADKRLELLRTLGISPIVGLTHHGSGPRHTSLVDSSFAEGLADFAEAVAQRYPWVELYTPVNEPLTTARFSGLYGHWYPHGRNQATFARALLTQCRAVVLAMQAVRRVNPSARLIQTEDLGKIFSTPLLADQADLENERRWLTFDLLCGRVGREHPMWNFLLAASTPEAELEWFLEHPCPPDVLGIDYYLTSERFLDEHLDRYPVEFHGGNGRQRYADTEVVRVDTGRSLPVGHYERLREAWERYHLPLAITEAHLGSTREEQLRWLVEAWSSAQALRQEGAQVRAVTAWSLLGAYDWNNLVTRTTNFYEPGVFDVRGDKPRPTAIARLVHTLTSGQQPEHPVLAQPGWWRRPDRFFYQSHSGVASPPTVVQQGQDRSRQARPLLITETSSTLGRAFAQLCDGRDLPYRFVTRREMDTSDAHSIHAVLTELKPWAVVSLSGCSVMRDEDLDAASWQCEYTWGDVVLANACAQHGIALVTFSSDRVFDGSQPTPYVESDCVAPGCRHGHMQAEMERLVLQRCPSALVIRTGPLLSPWESPNMVTANMRHHLAGRHLAPSEMVISPTYVPDMVHACLDLLIDGERGRWHLANGGALSWAQLIRRVAELTGSEMTSVLEELEQEQRSASFHLVSRTLGSEHGQLLPSLDDALCRYTREGKEGWGKRVA